MINFEKKKILITGSNGFIGKVLLAPVSVTDPSVTTFVSCKPFDVIIAFTSGIYTII